MRVRVRAAAFPAADHVVALGDEVELADGEKAAAVV
jgi:hypothetical protein